MKHNNFQFRAIFLSFVAAAWCAYPVCSQNATSSGETLTKILKDNETKRPTESTITQIQAILDKDPKNYYARLVMGNTLDRVGLPMQAIEQYQLAVQYGPNSPKAIIELVKAQISVGQKEAAMRLLQEANKRFPDDPEITYWVGNYYLAKRDLKAATENFNKAQRSGRKIFGMATARAEMMIMLRNWEQAIVLANLELADNPNYPLANAVKGVALFNLHKFKEANPYLKTAFANFPLKQDYAKEYAETCLFFDNTRAALEPAMVAVAVFSSNHMSVDAESKWLLNYVISRLPFSYVKEQVPIIMDKIEKPINNAPMHLAFGEIFDANGYHDLAVTQFYRSYQLNPAQASVAYKLANDLELYFQKYDDAILYLSKAHALSPNDSEIADRLERLQNRLPGRKADLAWQLKDLLRSQRSPI